MKECNACWLHKIALVLVIVGGLNWGLVGAFDWNLVDALLGDWPGVMRVVYILVGLGALAMIPFCWCKACKMK